MLKIVYLWKINLTLNHVVSRIKDCSKSRISNAFILVLILGTVSKLQTSLCEKHALKEILKERFIKFSHFVSHQCIVLTTEAENHKYIAETSIKTHSSVLLQVPGLHEKISLTIYHIRLHCDLQCRKKPWCSIIFKVQHFEGLSNKRGRNGGRYICYHVLSVNKRIPHSPYLSDKGVIKSAGVRVG